MSNWQNTPGSANENRNKFVRTHTAASEQFILWTQKQVSKKNQKTYNLYSMKRELKSGTSGSLFSLHSSNSAAV